MSHVIDIAALFAAGGFSLEEIERRAELAAERAVRRVLAEQAERLEPLSVILGISSKAAHARLARDPQLRRIGVQVGARCLFKRNAVEGYFRTKAER